MKGISVTGQTEVPNSLKFWVSNLVFLIFKKTQALEKPKSSLSIAKISFNFRIFGRL